MPRNLPADLFELDPRLRSKAWRMTHLYKILDKEGRLVVFKPKLIQLMLVVTTRGLRRWLILKARQLGVTTFYAIDLLDDALWTPGQTCAIIAHKQKALNGIFEIVRRAYKNLPEELMPITREDTANGIKFDFAYNGMPLDSEIYVALELRSGTVQRLHITESAYIKNRQELEAGSKQAVPKTGIISEETTANGLDAFHDMFVEAKNNPNPGPLDYHAIFIPWHDDPDYSLPGTIGEGNYTQDEIDLKLAVLREYKKTLTDQQLLWRRWKIKDLKNNNDLLGLRPEQLFKQEYPSTWMEAFQSGAGNVFDNEIIMNTPAMLPIETRQNGLKIWELPKPGGEYLMGVDPAGDEAEDEGTICIWNAKTLGKCAEWSGKIRPDELAILAAAVGEEWNWAYAGIENNMLTTILAFVKLYPPDRTYSRVVLDQRFQKKTKKVGWNTNSATRDLLIDDFIALHEDGELTIRSGKTLDQMRTFVKKENGKREHANGKHDDVLFADMIAVYMRKFHARKRKKARVATR